MRPLLLCLGATVVLFAFGSAQADDPNEPNDSRDTATPVTLTDTVTGSIDDFADHDWYAVAIPEPGDFHAEVFGSDDSFLLVDVRLYSAAGSYLGDYGGWIETPGTIYVELEAFDDGFSPPPGDYRLVLSHYPALEPSGGLQPLEPVPFEDPFAEENASDSSEDRAPGRESATRIEIGDRITLDADGSAADVWYRVDLPAAGLLLVSLEKLGGESDRGSDPLPPLSLYDGHQAWERNEGRARDDAGVTWHAARIASGTAYLLLQPGWGWDAEAGAYEIETRFLPAATALADNWPDCSVAGPKATAGEGLNLTYPAGAEVICYQVRVPRAGWLGPEGRVADFEDHGERLWLEVGREVDGLPVLYGGGATPLPPDTYRVAAWRQDKQGRQQFHLHNAFVEPLPDSPIALHPHIGLGAETRNGGARVAIDPAQRETRVDLTLEQGGMLAGALLGGPPATIYVVETGAGAFDWQRQLPLQLPPGDYELIVAAEERWPWPFDLQLALYPAVDPCEPNETEDEACPLALGETQPLRLASPGDVDWFAVDLEKPGLVAIVLDGMPAPTFDEDGFQTGGLWPNAWFGWEVHDGLAASNPALGIVGYLRVKEPGTYRFALSGEWLDGDPLTPLEVTAIQVTPDGSGDTAVFAMGDAVSSEERAELEFLAGLSNGTYAERLDADGLIQAVRALMEQSP